MDPKQMHKENKLLEKLKQKFDLCRSYYTGIHRRMRLLDMTDRGDLWKSLKRNFPPYQILPNTNHVNYVKSNLVASIYTVMKSASIQPTSEQDKDLTTLLNVAMDSVWDLADVGYYQFKAGERAALLNIGITQVGWDNNVSAGTHSAFYKGNVTFKNIDPMHFMRDPFAEDLDTAGYCITYEQLHKSAILQNPKYKKAFKEYLDKNSGAPAMPIPELQNSSKQNSAPKDYYTLVCFWLKDGEKMREIHTVNCEAILYQNDDIKPAVFPFAILYCNEPAGDLVGTSPCAQILANSIAYNLMESIALTSEYKNQKPPKFISAQSGLNIQSFAKHGDDAEKTFIVNGRADQAVHYHQFPQVSNQLYNLSLGLQNDIQNISGVDGRYTGRDTGSVITTGGVEDMLNRVTLIDTPKITLYEKYTKRLTQLVLSNMLEFCPKRSYFRRQPNSNLWENYEIDFPNIDADTLFNYALNISSELPKNKQRIATMANVLMEKQMQYNQQGNNVQLITEEEWLMFQDFPNKEYMLERMGIQRQQDAVETVTNTLFDYANLVQQGMDPNNAILQTADMMNQRRQGQEPSGEIPPELMGGDITQMPVE
jgi:hypothetical protein